MQTHPGCHIIWPSSLLRETSKRSRGTLIAVMLFEMSKSMMAFHSRVCLAKAYAGCTRASCAPCTPLTMLMVLNTRHQALNTPNAELKTSCAHCTPLNMLEMFNTRHETLNVLHAKTNCVPLHPSDNVEDVGWHGGAAQPVLSFNLAKF